MTEQEKIEQAAQEGANRCCESEAYGYIQGFPDGASYYASEIMPGMMEKFAEYLNKQSVYKNANGKWCHWDTYIVFAESTQQLLEKYFEQSKQKENGHDKNP